MNESPILAQLGASASNETNRNISQFETQWRGLPAFSDRPYRHDCVKCPNQLFIQMNVVFFGFTSVQLGDKKHFVYLFKVSLFYENSGTNLRCTDCVNLCLFASFLCISVFTLWVSHTAWMRKHIWQTELILGQWFMWEIETKIIKFSLINFQLQHKIKSYMSDKRECALNNSRSVSQHLRASASSEWNYWFMRLSVCREGGGGERRSSLSTSLPSAPEWRQK